MNGFVSQKPLHLYNYGALSEQNKILLLKFKPYCMKIFKQIIMRFSLGLILLLSFFLVSSQSAKGQCQNVNLTANSYEGCAKSPTNAAPSIKFNLSNVPNNYTDLKWKWGGNEGSVRTTDSIQTHNYPDDGTYEPKVVIYGPNGDSLCQVDLVNNEEINIYDNPTADFSVTGQRTQCFAGNEFCANLNIQRSDDDAPIPCNNKTFTWGDGTKDICNINCHNFQNSGEFTQVLQVTDTNGCFDIVEKTSYLEVLEPLNPDFSIAFPNGQPGCPKTLAQIINNTKDSSRFESITYVMADSNKFDTTPFYDDILYQEGLRQDYEADNLWATPDNSNGWGGTDFTYTEDGEFFPKVIVRDTVGCTDTFEYEAGVRNINFSLDTTPFVDTSCFSDPALEYSHSNRPNAFGNTWLFQGGTPQAPQPHMPPPQPQVQNQFSGTHEYPNYGVKHVFLRITEVPNRCVKDTTYYSQHALLGPQAQINTPAMVAPPNTIVNSKDRPIFKSRFINAQVKGCLEIDEIEYVTRTPAGGFSGPQTWQTSSNTLPYQMVNFPFETDTFYHKNDSLRLAKDSFLLDEMELRDTIDKSTAVLEFLDTNVALAYSNNYGANDTSFDIRFHNNNAYLVWGLADKPTFPPYRFVVKYTAGDSTVYQPPEGMKVPRNMHDSDRYDPDCGAPNLVRFTNNSKKFRLVKNDSGGKRTQRIDPNTPLEIDSIAPNGSDTFYVVDSVTPTNDTIYAKDTYEGFRGAFPTDEEAPIEVVDTSYQQYAENHKAIVEYYADKGFSVTIDSTAEKDRPDDLSPWSSDSLNYIWRFADPEGESCTTRTEWASQQANFYTKVVDTVEVPSFPNDSVAISLSSFLPNDFNDTVNNVMTNIEYLNKLEKPSGSLYNPFKNYGENHDLLYKLGGPPKLRIWDDSLNAGDSVIFAIRAGDTSKAGRNCNFSSAPAPYHFYDSTGCWTVTMEVNDTVTGCSATDNVRIFMEPPQADWDKEFFYEERSKVLAFSYGGSNNFLLDSLGTASDSTKWAVRVLDERPVKLYHNNSRIPSYNYEVINDNGQSKVLVKNPSNWNSYSSETISADYYVKQYALFAGDTVNIDEMTYGIQRQLPPYDPENPEKTPRKGLQVDGPKCQFAIQQLNFEETVPYTSCDGTGEAYGVAFDTGGFDQYNGRPFKQGTKTCTDSIDRDNDGKFDSAITRTIPELGYIPGSDPNVPAWSDPLEQQGPNRFRYQTPGCKSVAVWIQSGNCYDTFIYPNYKRINALDFRFNILDPDSTRENYRPLSDNELQRTFCVGEIGDTTKIPGSPVRGGQRRIVDYSMSANARFLTRQYKYPTANNPVERESYDLYKDTAYRFCDSVGKDSLGNEACFGDNFVWPELTCGESLVNNRSFSELQQDFDVFDTIPFLDMGDTLKADSIAHSQIGQTANPTQLYKFPQKSKAYWFYIEIEAPLDPSVNYDIVSLDANGSIKDYVLDINNQIGVNNTDSIILDGAKFDYIESPSDSTTLAIVKDGSTSQGAITIYTRYKPVFNELPVKKPGVYNINSRIQNSEGCAAAASALGGDVTLYVGHFARFDPKTDDPDISDSAICADDTVYFHNSLQDSRGSHYGNEFPRYYNVHPWEQDPRITHFLVKQTDTTNFWRDPKGMRGPRPAGFNYEKLEWDLNGDGYYETRYDIDTLRYIQDKDMDSTFEDTLDLYDADDDGSLDTVPYYAYDSGGVYDVSMKSVDSNGCAQVMTKNNLIIATEVTAFMDTAESPGTCAPQTVDFADSSEISFGYRYLRDAQGNITDSVAVDSVVDWQWEFRDGRGDSSGTASIQDPSYVYQRNGTYVPKLTIETSTGCLDSTTKVKHANDTSDLEIPIRGPIPYFRLMDTLKCVPGEITVFDSSKNTGRWVFNKGNGQQVSFDSLESREDSTFDLRYEEAGLYRISLKLFDSVANTSTPNPNDSTWCAADYPVYQGFEDQDSGDYLARIKPTDVADFDAVPNSLCANEGDDLELYDKADTAYDAINWVVRGDTVGPVQRDDVADITYNYTENTYDTFGIKMIPRGEDTLCYDTAYDTARSSRVVANLDTIDSETDMPVFTFKNKSEYGNEFRWIFFDNKIDTTRKFGQDIDGLARYRHPRNDNDKNDFETEDSTFRPSMDYHADRGYYDVCLIATNAQNCSDTACMQIQNYFDTSYERPNVFTPNGDGDNDRFSLRMQGDEAYTMKIYNRWGEVVYKTDKEANNNECFWTNEVSDKDYDCKEASKDPENPRGCKYCKFWNGTTQNGNEAPAGTYFYKITYEQRHQDSQVVQGTVTLIR